ncbi:hypothetical protein LINGRAHAP2_LOCUS12235 [Linum grandiflorum]
MKVPPVKLASVRLLILLLVAAYILSSSLLHSYGYEGTVLQISSWREANGDAEIAGEKNSVAYRRSLATKKLPPKKLPPKKLPPKKAPPAPVANRMKSNNIH